MVLLIVYMQLVVNDGVKSQKSIGDLLAIFRQIVDHFKRSTDAIYATNPQVHVSRGVRTGGQGCYGFHTIFSSEF